MPNKTFRINKVKGGFGLGRQLRTSNKSFKSSGQISSPIPVSPPVDLPVTLTLNTDHIYGTDTQRMFLFTENGGTLSKDYSPAAADATITNGTWQVEGLEINQLNDLIATSMPSLGSNESFFIKYKGVGGGFGPVSGYTRIFAQDLDNGNLNLLRSDSDTLISAQINGSSVNMVVPDLWDNSEHTLLFTWDDINNKRSIFIDGVLASEDLTAFIVSSFSSLFIIGNRGDAQRPAMMQFQAFYIWSKTMVLADAVSLHNDSYQMFHNPPDRRKGAIDYDFNNQQYGQIWPQALWVMEPNGGVLDSPHVHLQYTTQGAADKALVLNIAPLQSNEFWVEFDLKIDSKPIGGCKFVKFFGSASTSSQNNITVVMDGDNATIHHVNYYGDTIREVEYGGNFVGGAPIFIKTGQTIVPNDIGWNRFKFFLKRSSIDGTDGEFKIWWNGDLLCHITNMESNPIAYAGTTNYFEVLEFGGYNAVNFITPWDLRIDNLYVDVVEKA